MPLLHAVRDIVTTHPFAVAAIAVGSVVVSVGATLLALIYLPADYFCEATNVAPPRHITMRVLLAVVRNVAGAILIVIGLLLSLPGVPGQGLLTILLGVMLLQVPGKRRLERRIMSIGMVQRATVRVRQRFGRPPFDLSE
jgi:hypothetical protein